MLKPATISGTPSIGSQNTLIVPSNGCYGDLDVVVFGTGNNHTAALMVGLTPAIEGAEATTPEIAMRKLMISTCELLKSYIPKVGAHQRAIHGGGVFDEDMISSEIVDAQKKRP